MRMGFSPAFVFKVPISRMLVAWMRGGKKMNLVLYSISHQIVHSPAAVMQQLIFRNLIFVCDLGCDPCASLWFCFCLVIDQKCSVQETGGQDRYLWQYSSQLFFFLYEIAVALKSSVVTVCVPVALCVACYLVIVLVLVCVCVWNMCSKFSSLLS